MAWFMANWPLIQGVLVGVLAVDAALIPIFPKVQILVTLKNLLLGVTPKA